MRNPVLLLVVFLLCCCALPASASAAAVRGVVNGYCEGGSRRQQLGCSLESIRANASFINSLSITSYHLNDNGSIETCSPSTPLCPFPGDVEAFNAAVMSELEGAVQVTPLVFDNDGDTVRAFRAMQAANLSDANIRALVSAAVRYNYTGLSMDWEPSCWQKKASLCQWPTVEEAEAYAVFLSSLASALAAVSLPLTVCADHEVCDPYSCGGDDYIQHCLNDEWDMAVCNCCAFQTWFNASRLCSLTSISRISVMDSYARAPFNSTVFQQSVQPWYDAGCAASRMSFGLLTDEASTEGELDLMFATIGKLGVKSVDIWVNPWRSADLTSHWADRLKRFIGSGTETAIA